MNRSAQVREFAQGEDSGEKQKDIAVEVGGCMFLPPLHKKI
jgi:hypothetical protein